MLLLFNNILLLNKRSIFLFHKKTLSSILIKKKDYNSAERFRLSYSCKVEKSLVSKTIKAYEIDSKQLTSFFRSKEYPIEL